MPAHRIGDILRRLFGNLKPASLGSGTYEWSFQGYGRCGGCERPIEWWWSANGSKVALDPDPTTVWTRGDVLHLARHDIEKLVGQRAHWVHCPDARFWRGRKRSVANCEDEALRRYERRLREGNGDRGAHG